MSENLSERAQEIRKQVVEQRNKKVTEMVDAIFGGILKTFEQAIHNRDNKILCKSCIDIWCDLDKQEIQYGDDGFGLINIALMMSLEDFLGMLKGRIEKEEGYKCDIKSFSNPERILLTVTIE